MQLSDLGSALAERGFSISQPFRLARYHEAVRSKGLPALQDFGRSDALAVLVGSTRTLWPALRRALAEGPALAASADPVDDYTESALAALLGALPMRAQAYVGREHGPVVVSLLHAAEAAGFAAVGPSWMAVHPVLGPWFGLRAVISVDAPYEVARGPAASPCTTCDAPCRAPFERARALHGSDPNARVADHYEAWLAVRDACPVGRQHRYHADQLRYHYTKDRALLR